MKKLRNSGKESDPRLLENHKIQADVKLSYIDAKLQGLHPVLRLDDHLGMLSRANRLDILCGGQDLFTATQLFWERFEGENPELVSKLRSERGQFVCLPATCCVWRRGAITQEGCIPSLRYATHYRFRHLLHEQGCPGDHGPKDLGVNMVGVSCLTRFVYSVMRASCYNKTPEVFHALLDNFSKHCDELCKDGISIWHEGYQQTIVLFPVVICAKGDWPFLKKCGNLARSHHQANALPGRGKGICHMCLAGTAAYSDWSKCRAGSWLCSDSLNTLQPPWSNESALTARLCRNSDMWQKTWFYRPDLFHTIHKGVMAELTGSAIDPGASLYIFVFLCLYGLFVHKRCAYHLSSKTH